MNSTCNGRDGENLHRTPSAVQFKVKRTACQLCQCQVHMEELAHLLKIYRKAAIYYWCVETHWTRSLQEAVRYLTWVLGTPAPFFGLRLLTWGTSHVDYNEFKLKENLKGYTPSLFVFLCFQVLVCGFIPAHIGTCLWNQRVTSVLLNCSPAYIVRLLLEPRA